jgi:hypothetical protein
MEEALLQKALREHWPLHAAIVLLLVLVYLVLDASLKQNGGNLVYPFDDAYIHMAIAKNFSQQRRAFGGCWNPLRFAPHASQISTR